MDLQFLFATLGTAAGLVYAALGISALKHLPDATAVDHIAGWNLWWFIERDRYDDAGQRLCTIGGVVFALAITSWVAWFLVG